MLRLYKQKMRQVEKTAAFFVYEKLRGRWINKVTFLPYSRASSGKLPHLRSSA